LTAISLKDYLLNIIKKLKNCKDLHDIEIEFRKMSKANRKIFKNYIIDVSIEMFGISEDVTIALTLSGQKDIGMKAWVKSAMGTGVAESLSTTAGGGFNVGASQADVMTGGGDMMTQRLKIMKETMLDATKGAATFYEKLFIQMKTAIKMLNEIEKEEFIDEM